MATTAQQDRLDDGHHPVASLGLDGGTLLLLLLLYVSPVLGDLLAYLARRQTLWHRSLPEQ
jgi:hypothetical protein